MKKKWRTQGLIVREKVLGERDKIITVLTRDRGRLEVFVRGARKFGFRYCGILQSFCWIDLWIEERNGYLYHVESALLKNYHKWMKGDSLSKWSVGNVIIEVLDHFGREGDISDELFGLLARYISCYDVINKYFDEFESAELYISSLLLSVLAVSGALPVLENCVYCGEPIQGSECVIGANGFLHNACAKKAGIMFTENSADISKIIILANTPVEELDGLRNIMTGEEKKIFSVVYWWWKCLFEKNVKAVDFWKTMYR